MMNFNKKYRLWKKIKLKIQTQIKIVLKPRPYQIWKGYAIYLHYLLYDI